MSDIMAFSPLWGEWHIKELIGKGSFGAVYRAEKTEYGNTYTSAVKHISIPGENVNAESLIADGLVPDEKSVPLYYDTVRDSIITEINFCYTLRGNTNIVSYEDHCIIPKKNGDGYDIFIRMEHLTALPKYMREHHFDEACVIQLGMDICAALEVLDKHRIIHRDIKPANIFVNSVGVYKLGDFGESKVLSGNNTGMTVRGTYTFMSPEISRGGQADIRADIYSLGIVMYRLLNGNKAPFVPNDSKTVDASVVEAANIRRFRGESLPLPQYCRNKALADVIMKACAFAPENRYQKPAELHKALEALQESVPSNTNTAETVSATAVSPSAHANKNIPATSPAPNNKKKTILTAAVIGAVAVGIAGCIMVPMLTARHGDDNIDAGMRNEERSDSNFSAVSGETVSVMPTESTVSADSSSVLPLKTLTIQSLPQKTDYTAGETLVTDGMTITAVYADGTTKDIPLSECTLKGFDSHTAGQQTITVSYDGQQTSFTVTVSEQQPQGLDSGICGERVSYRLDHSGVLTISGQGAMKDYSLGYVVQDDGTIDVQCNYPWLSHADDIRRIVVEEGVTGIGKFAFYGLRNVTDIALADSVTALGESCLRACDKLTSLFLPTGVSVLGEECMFNCPGLQTIEVAEDNAAYASVEGVLYTKDKRTLLKCPEAKEGSVGVDNSTVIIGEWAFDNCMKVTEVILPVSVTTIESFAFSNCRSIASIFILPNVRKIEASAFRYWQSSQEIRFIEMARPGAEWSDNWNRDCQAAVLWNAEQYAMG